MTIVVSCAKYTYHLLFQCSFNCYFNAPLVWSAGISLAFTGIMIYTYLISLRRQEVTLSMTSV
jgi:hypothetical protein